MSVVISLSVIVRVAAVVMALWYLKSARDRRFLLLVVVVVLLSVRQGFDVIGHGFTLLGVDVSVLEEFAALAGGMMMLVAIATFGRLSRDNIAELHRSEALLANAQRIAHLGNWERNLETNELSCSDEIYRIHGLQPGAVDLTLEMALGFIHPADRHLVDEAMAINLSNPGAPFDSLEHRIVRPDGEIRVVHSQAKVTFDDAGKAVRITTVVQDVTEQRRAMRELEQSEARLANAQRIAHLGHWERNLETNEISCSDEIYRIYGLEAGAVDLTLEMALGFVHPADRHLVDEAMAEDPGKPRVPSYSLELRIVRPDGGIRVIHNQAEVTFDDTGKAVRVTIVVQDVTEQRRMAEQLQRHADELERSNADLEQFAFVASHDLRAPLRGIDTVAGWIEEDLGDLLQGETRQNMALLRGRVRRLEDLLESLLQYSRVGRVRGAAVKTDVGELIETTRDTLNLPENFAVEVRAPMPVLKTDRTALGQVFANLIGNAVKHHDRDHGHITVSAIDKGTMVEFRVEDDGPGIPEEFRERVFAMFQTLKPRDELEASGMGLAIVKRAVERNGGSIRIEDGPDGRGAAFIFTWPRNAKEQDQ